ELRGMRTSVGAVVDSPILADVARVRRPARLAPRRRRHYTTRENGARLVSLAAPPDSKSSQPILETRGLTKRFGARAAVESLDLDVRAGDIFGFLGPNGAGKTTTIRMLLRLIRPTSGEIRVFGKPLDESFLETLSHVGALVEEPAFYP